jgi:hypothetical protein
VANEVLPSFVALTAGATDVPVTIQVNGTVNTLVHKMSNGISTATLPDVCKTPTPGGPAPLPYPNIAQSITLSGGTTTVKGDRMMAANKGSKFAMSNGDQAGTLGGVKSNVFMKEATWILYSFDVKVDGKNACRLTDKMFHNSQNAANLAGVIQAVIDAHGLDAEEVEIANALCEEVCKAEKNAKKKKLKKGVHHQDAIAKKFSKGPPRYEPTKYKNLLPEATWGVPAKSSDALISCVSRTREMLPGVAAAASPRGAINTLRSVPNQCGFRPDFTLLKDAKKGVTDANVKRFFECKIGKDTPTDNQVLAKKHLDAKGEGNKLVTLDKTNCGC